jgi:hypothetical protein
MNRMPDLTWLRDERVLVAISVATAVGFTAGLLVFGQPWNLPPNYGDVPTWLAVVFAAIAGWVGLSQLRILRRQVAREAFDRRRAQASRVFVWVKQERSKALSQAQRAGTGQQLPETIVIARITNTSEQPIYDLELTWHEGAALRGSVEARGVLMPGKQEDLKRQVPENFSPASRERFGVTLGFRDAAGVRWTVDQDGHLVDNTQEPT